MEDENLLREVVGDDKNDKKRFLSSVTLVGKVRVDRNLIHRWGTQPIVRILACNCTIYVPW